MNYPFLQKVKKEIKESLTLERLLVKIWNEHLPFSRILSKRKS